MKPFFVKKIFLFCISFLVVERFCYWQTRGFRLSKVALAEGEDKVQICLLHPFNQPYSYLGGGAQFYAFVSEDGRYVLKLFKTHHGLFASKEKKKRRLSRLFHSARLAQERLSRETGILLLHLGKTKHLYGKMSIYDPLHIAHSIDLDCTAFILQKHAKPAGIHLQTQLHAGKIPEAKASIEALLHLAEDTVFKGIKNKDIKLIRNCGFSDNLPLILDIGSLSLREEENKEARKKVRKKAALQLRKWLLFHYPDKKELIP